MSNGDRQEEQQDQGSVALEQRVAQIEQWIAGAHYWMRDASSLTLRPLLPVRAKPLEPDIEE